MKQKKIEFNHNFLIFLYIYIPTWVGKMVF